MEASYQGSVLWLRGACRQLITQDRVQSVYSVHEAIDATSGRLEHRRF
jgi:hypothetical protein